MAENEVVEVEAKERKRKPNFSANEISIITESVTHHFDVINSKLTNNVRPSSDAELFLSRT